jgi:putative photosynthetic complex assembly protein
VPEGRAIVGAGQPEAFPRGPLLGAAALIVFALLVAALARALAPAHPPAGPPAVAERQLRFMDRPDGSVLVEDAGSGATVATLPAGADNFTRGILRALARQRRLRGLTAEDPFRLARLADGRLLLEDPATGERVDLGSFGPTNAAAMARLLP